MTNGKSSCYIYYCKDDQTLKISKINKRYYFDIELESEGNELLESTQFKIVVDRYQLFVAAIYVATPTYLLLIVLPTIMRILFYNTNFSYRDPNKYLKLCMEGLKPELRVSDWYY